MSAEPALSDEEFIIKDLETGKRYRINESGDRIEISDGEQIAVDDFLDLFGYLKLPKPGTPVGKLCFITVIQDNVFLFRNRKRISRTLHGK